MNLKSALPLLLMAAAGPAHPVTIQYAGGFGMGSGNYTGVPYLYQNGCSGALLADGIHVLTAAHCAASISVNGLFQTILTPDITSLLFYTAADPGELIDAVTQVQFNPLTTEWFPTDPSHTLLMYDVAILTLADPAPADATRYNLDLSGYAITHNSPVVMAGWGLGGYPGGDVSGTGATRRAGTNTVAGVFSSADDPDLAGDPSVLLVDHPIALQWTTTSDTGNPSDTLGLPNAGDSGGPLLYNGNLIGLTSFGDLPRSGVVPVGQLYQAGDVNLSDPGNANWLNSVLNGTPEPGTWMLAAGGTLLLWLRRRALA